MKFIMKHKVLFYLLQYTWGILINIIGIFVTLALLITKHKPYKFGNSYYFIVGKNWGGVNFGTCFLCAEESLSHHLKCHEAGHGIQNIIMGPLFVFIVAIPSAVRYWYFEYCNSHHKEHSEYESIWFEAQATKLGEKYYG